ncbi:hypothetical protein EIN_431190, partial [Entamoeba invadens IP1]
NCERFVCNVIGQRKVYKTEAEAKAACPQLVSKCAIQQQGCGLGDNVDLSSENGLKSVGDSYRRHVEVYDKNASWCALKKGINLNTINVFKDDEYECLSQVVGCADYLSPEFGDCDEASLLSNVFMFNERVLPTSQVYRLKRATASTNAIFNEYTLKPGYKQYTDSYATRIVLDSFKDKVSVFFKYFNREISAFVSDCIMEGAADHTSLISGTFPLTIKTLSRDKSIDYEFITLAQNTHVADDLVVFEFDRCYACGSSVVVGITEKAIKLNGAQSPLGNWWDDKTNVVKDNLGFEIPVFFNDSIGGLDENFVIGYMVGDGLEILSLENPDNVDVYIGISEFSTVDFTQTDKFSMNDLLIIRNTTVNGKLSYWAEPLYLTCVLTSTDENKLVFDFKNTYSLCKIPPEVLKTITPTDTLFPIYRLPKNQIVKNYPEEGKASKIVTIVVPSVVGLIVICVLFIGTIVFIVRYRKMKGREMLKEYSEFELSSLGGPLIQYD